MNSENIGTLSSRAMLIDLTISCWVARLKDEKATKDAIEANKARGGAGRFNKYLIDVEAPTFAAVRAIASEIRAFHYANTLPWSAVARVLPAANFIAHADGISRLREKYNRAIDEFVADMPNLIEQARIMLGDLYIESEYPTGESLRSKFGVEVEVYPLPDAGDFRVHLTDDHVSAIRKQIEASAQKAAAVAMRDCYERLHGVVAKMADSLSDPDKKFRDSLVGNLREVCEVLPRLNITNDATLEALGRDVADRLGRHDADVLRTNESVRENVAQQARALEKRMAGLFGGAK